MGEGAGHLGKIRVSRQRGQHLQEFRGKTEELGQAHGILCGRCTGGSVGDGAGEWPALCGSDSREWGGALSSAAWRGGGGGGW